MRSLVESANAFCAAVSTSALGTKLPPYQEGFRFGVRALFLNSRLMPEGVSVASHLHRSSYIAATRIPFG